MRKRDLILFLIPALLLVAVAAWLTAKSSRLAPPHTIRITSGADGSSYRKFADKYKAIIERYGVKVEVLPSAGAIENLRRLADRSAKVDVGFVQGGVKEGIDVTGLVSLGSIAEQPLIVYYRAPEPVERLSELRGQRLAIGMAGSGTHALAMKLLGASNMTGPPTTLIELAGDKAAAALIAGQADAIFIVGDAATPALMQKMRSTPGIRLLSFRQAEAYTRKFQFLSKLTLPEGALDLEHDYPAEPVQLVGPTVELVARDTLHPALSDLLISAAREVHGGPGLFRNAGEYPAPLARDFPLSHNAERYYKSGEQFLYKWLPFWLASLLDRLLVVLVPTHRGGRPDHALAAGALPLADPVPDLPVVRRADAHRARPPASGVARAAGGAGRAPGRHRARRARAADAGLVRRPAIRPARPRRRRSPPRAPDARRGAGLVTS